MFTVLSRRFVIFAKYGQKYCSKATTHNKIKELITTVHPYGTVKVNLSVKVKIRPFDLLDCPDANKLRATLITTSSKAKADLKVKVEDGVALVTDEHVKGDIHKLLCLLEVPVKSDLDVISEQDVNISEMYSDVVKVVGKKNVLTKDLRSSAISLISSGGNVQCEGLTLAHKIDIFASDKGNISLDKLQGDLMHCKSEKGTISTNSCYVETSKFVTETGQLNLKNIHKKSEIYVLKEGNLDMTGIHGNVYIKSNAGDLNLQFSEITGDNIIIANNSKNVTINISDLIEESCFVEIHADKVALEDSIGHLSHCVKDGNYFRLGVEDGQKNKLLICTTGQLRLGKMSWADSLKVTMGIKDL